MDKLEVYNIKKTSKPKLTPMLSLENIKTYVLPLYQLNDGHVEYVKFKNTNKQRAVYKITLGEKEYCLKKVYYGVDKLLFIYSAIEWWSRHHIKVPYLLPSKDKKRYAIYNEMLFILTPWIHGDKCDYDNINNLHLLFNNLSKMHKSSLDFFPMEYAKTVEDYSDIYCSLKKHWKNLFQFYDMASEIKDRFSLKYMYTFSKNNVLAQLSCNAARIIDFDKLTKSLCHGDYVNKNIIFTEEKNEISVIDFDKVSMNYVARDISYALRRILKRESTNWDFQLLIELIHEYNKNLSLTKDDYIYIFAYLSFPQKYWRISRDYFNNIEKCNKDTFYTLLCKATAHTENHYTFCCRFKAYLQAKFNIVF
ncbi:spore coat protein, CotS family [Hathewaya proteolytica DSM 3090]|uniref:Spore coat protein, CotS family n=1 Tax=Hathewaya proteolytica DSM 3090 TaxID=1121331 RepID=A0A1M6JEK8_9CLOT|nr:CotS family spore coat protein [Hathewaya proteolytica]SHJ45149.1 spore coat protein, CotS family [Hathewaya proteolytica DSM 3090]